MKRYLSLALVGVATTCAFRIGYIKFLSSSEENEFSPTGIVGVQHLGHEYSVSEFYVNKYGGTNVGRDGGGGGSVCCIMIPGKWRPGLTVEVRWEVADWSQENRKQITAGNYESILKKGMYIATVPVEKYEIPGELYVHFFPRGRVRVVSTMYSVLSKSHPVKYGGPIDGGTLATAGWPIKEMFTQAESQAMDRRRNAWK